MSCAASGDFFGKLCILKNLQDKESRVVLVPVYCFLLDLKFLHYIIIHSFLFGFRNEKDGIRSDILVLLDSYVEIPQLGVLRSLNVHVTGAVFMWEYVKQHCLSSDT